MRTLTAEQAAVLAEELRDPTRDIVDGEEPILDSLVDRGLCITYPGLNEYGGECVWWRTTPMARLALDCYRAVTTTIAA